MSERRRKGEKWRWHGLFRGRGGGGAPQLWQVCAGQDRTSAFVILCGQ